MNRFALGILVALVFSACSPKVTVNYKFTGIRDGYDHKSRTHIYVDGEKAATSSEALESKPNSVSTKVPKGEHDIKVINEAFYEGKWEEHTVENGYSIDCKYENTFTFGKSRKINMVFDIDSEKAKIDVK